MCSLKTQCTTPYLGLVLMSVHICPIGQFLMVTSPWSTLSLIKKVLQFNMFSALWAAGSAIYLRQHCTHVVLVKEQCLHVETLFLNEGACPEDASQWVIHSNQFRLGGTLCVNFLFPWIAKGHPLPQAHPCTCVSSAIIVDRVRHVHLPSRESQQIRW